MFGIGFPEFILILVVALVVLGPKKLPELARSIGKGLAEFKKSAEELKENLNLGEDLKEVRKDLNDIMDPAQYLKTTELSHASDTQKEKVQNPPSSEPSSTPAPKAPDA
ncbi:MAG: Sec-independent protein translocase protein TatB [Thermodesulfobacteriota bacterium]|jgi:Tat protein translocase TatB subunit